MREQKLFDPRSSRNLGPCLVMISTLQLAFYAYLLLESLPQKDLLTYEFLQPRALRQLLRI